MRTYPLHDILIQHIHSHVGGGLKNLHGVYAKPASIPEVSHRDGDEDGGRQG